MGEKDYMGSILVADFIFGYFMGSFFEGLVVDFFAGDAYGTGKNSLPLVDRLGF